MFGFLFLFSERFFMFVVKVITLPFRITFLCIKELFAGLFRLIRFLIKTWKETRTDENNNTDNTLQTQK